MLFSVSTSSSAAEWEAIGPFGGDQFDVRIVPGNPDTLYALAIHGIHRSRDAGDTWERIHTRDMFIGFVGFNIDPNDTAHLHVGTWETGVWESWDEGDTWSDCGLGLPTLVDAPDVYHPVVSLAQDGDGQLIAALGSIGDRGEPPARIYRSVSGCNDWVADDAGIEPAGVAETQDVQTLVSTDANGRVWAISYGAGVYRSEAGHWMDASGDLPLAAMKTTVLAHDPDDPDRVILGTEDHWIFESLDAGLSWTPWALPEQLVGLSQLPLVYMIAIDPNNSRLAIAQAIDNSIPPEIPLFSAQPSQDQGLGAYLTRDGGITWDTQRALFLRIAIDPRESVLLEAQQPPNASTPQISRIWYSTTVGMNAVTRFDRKTDSAEVITDGIEGAVMNRVWVSPQTADSSESIVLAMLEGYLTRYERDTDAWEHYETYSFSDDIGFVSYNWAFAADWLDEGRIYFATGDPAWQFQASRGVYAKSLDCFSAPCDAPEQLLADVGVWQIVSTPLRPETLYATTQGDGILLSEDRGSSWSDLSEGLPAGASVTDLILDETGGPLLAALRTWSGEAANGEPEQWWVEPNEDGAVYVFKDEGWVRAAGIDAAVLDLESHPSDLQTLYAGTSRGVFRSIDRGQNWECVAPPLLTYALAVDPAHPDYLFAATARGVFRSTNSGAQWHDFSDGLPLDLMHSISLDSQTGVLYVGTAGNSVYRLTPDENPEPQLRIDPPVLDFGVVPVGFHDDARIVVSNDGEADLWVEDILVSGAAFSLPDGFKDPLRIPPRSSESLHLRFSPQSVGETTGTISITSNDQTATQSVSTVNGEGRAAVDPSPDARVNGSETGETVDFGDSVTLSTHLTAGDYLGRLVDVWIGFSTPYGVDYWLVEGAGWVESETPLRAFVAPVADFEEFLPAIELAPAAAGDYVFTFALDDNSDGVYDGTWRDDVGFTVQPPPAQLIVVPGALDFGTVAVGSSNTLAVGLGNTGGQPLTVDSVALGDPSLSLLDPPSFPIVLDAGESTALLVTYAPLSVGPMASTLSVRSNAEQTPREVAVTAAGRESVAPVPDARIAGTDAGGRVDFGQSVTFSTHLTANDSVGREADLWVSWTAPTGSLYWLVYGEGWVASETPRRLGVLPMGDYDPLFSFEFLPPVAGEHSFTFAIDDNTDGVFDGTWSDTVTFVVNEQPPVLVAFPDTLDFGDVPVGSESTKTVAIGNVGGRELVIDTVDFGDPALAQIDPPEMPIVLASGESILLSLVYAPIEPGALSSSVSFLSNAGVGSGGLLVTGAAETAAVPALDARINDSDLPGSIVLGQSVWLSIHLEAGDYLGQDADFWVSMRSPQGETQWLVYGTGWVVSDAPLRFFAAPIASYGEVFGIPFSPTDTGEYALRFAVDNNADGALDETWSDTVSILVDASEAV